MATQLVPSQNYAELHKQALGLIEQLASEQWTDYNASDTGITITEQLCYALTDLGYRSNYSIADLLASDQNAQVKAFFPAAEILPSGTITKRDWRKLVAAQPSIANIWLDREKQANTNLSDTYCASIEFTDNALNNRLYKTDSRANSAGIGSMEILAEGSSASTDGSPVFMVADSYIMDVIFPLWHEVNPLWRKPLDIIEISLPANAITTLTDQPYNYSVTLKISLKTGETIALVLGIQIDSADGSDTSDKVFRQIITERLTYKSGDLSSNKEILDQVFTPFNQTITNVYKQIALLDQALAPRRELASCPIKYQAINRQELGIEASIFIETGTDQNQIKQQIAEQLQFYFTPQVKLSSVTELQQNNQTFGDIYDGSLLTKPDQFLTNQELTRLDMRKRVYANDLVAQLTDIQGVLGVEHLILLVYSYNQLTERSSSVLDIKPPFDKAVYRHIADKITFQEVPADIFTQNTKASAPIVQKTTVQKTTAQKSIATQSQGQDMEVTAYTPTYQQFPAVYGVGKSGLGIKEKPARHAQAKQLQAYLAVFEQLMADHLARLGQVKSLFAVDQRTDYDYAQLNKVAPYAQPIFSSDYTSAKLIEINKASGQDPDHYNWQFNQHLLARLGQDVTKIAINKQTRQSLTARLLKDYPTVSGEPGKSFNLLATRTIANKTQPDAWNSTNISGLERRLYYLLDLAAQGCQRKNLVTKDDKGQIQVTGGFYLLEHGLFTQNKGFTKLKTGYQFHTSYILPAEATEFVNKKSEVEQLIVQETPAHLCTHFYWLDNTSLTKFQDLYKKWLENYMKWISMQYTAAPLAASKMRIRQNALIKFLNAR